MVRWSLFSANKQCRTGFRVKKVVFQNGFPAKLYILAPPKGAQTSLKVLRLSVLGQKVASKPVYGRQNWFWKKTCVLDILESRGQS